MPASGLAACIPHGQSRSPSRWSLTWAGRCGSPAHSTDREPLSRLVGSGPPGGLARGGRRGRGALEEEPSLARVAREGRRALEFGARFVEPTDLREEVSAHARQEVVALEGRLGDEGVDESESRRRT